MKSRRWQLPAVVVVACLTTMVSPSSPSSADEQPETARAESVVLHRVVWDEWQRGRQGFHLRSARVDGSDKRRVYDSPTGLTLDLTMDPRGRWVAFSPCCRKEFPTLVVARVRGGTVLQPLADHSKIYFVLGTVRNTVIGEALAGTRDGILYSDYRNLRSAKAGESHLVMRRVRSVRISGDGEHIVTERYQRSGRHRPPSGHRSVRGRRGHHL